MAPLLEVEIKQTECPRPGCGGKLLKDANNELYCINCGWRQNTPLDEVGKQNNKKPKRYFPAGNPAGSSKYSLEQRVEIARRAKQEGINPVSVDVGIPYATVVTWVRNLEKLESRLEIERSNVTLQEIPSPATIKDIHHRIDTMKLVLNHSSDNFDLSTKTRAWLDGYIEALEWVLEIHSGSGH
jgi:ribosomal protein S27AE